jgi:hypothetical protein
MLMHCQLIYEETRWPLGEAAAIVEASYLVEPAEGGARVTSTAPVPTGSPKTVVP